MENLFLNNENENYLKQYRDSNLDKFINYGDEFKKSQQLEESQISPEENMKITDYINMIHTTKKEKDPKTLYTEFRKKQNPGIDVNKFKKNRRRSSLVRNESESDYIEFEREKIKEKNESILEKEIIQKNLEKSSYKSRSFHSYDSMLYPKQTIQALTLNRFARDSSFLSKINTCIFFWFTKHHYIIVEKKTNYTNCFLLTSDLILEKKKKNLNLRKELTEAQPFHYLEMNKLYESFL